MDFSMRPIILIAIFLSLTSAATYTAAILWYIPAQLEKTITLSLNRLGFEDIKINHIEHHQGKIIFKKISLDIKSFSQIDAMEVEYSFLTYFTSGFRAKNITLRGLSLTGELLDQNAKNIFGTIRIAGWINDGKALQTVQTLPAYTLTITDSNLDLLSERFGGLNVNIEGQIRRAGSGNTEIRGRLSSRQNTLGMQAKISGTMNTGDTINLTADIEELRINIDNLQITRANATMSYITFSDKIPSFSVQASAGSMTWHNMPVRDVSISIEQSADINNLLIEGISIGQENIEFTTNINHKDSIIHYEGSLHAPDSDQLMSYLVHNRKILGPLPLPAFIKKNEGPVLDTRNA